MELLLARSFHRQVRHRRVVLLRLLQGSSSSLSSWTGGSRTGTGRTTGSITMHISCGSLSTSSCCPKHDFIAVRSASTSTTTTASTTASTSTTSSITQLQSPTTRPGAPLVRILYGSQGGTAQVFAMQLHQELEEQRGGDANANANDNNLEILPLNDLVQGSTFSRDNALFGDWNSIHVILVSVAGVGEPPDNARMFYEWLMHTNNDDDDDTNNNNIGNLKFKYTIFGLGNSIAHPKHFNIIAKNMDSKLQELGAERIYPIGLGDDGDCIEDDFDQWMEGLLKCIRKEEIVQHDDDLPLVVEASGLEKEKSDHYYTDNTPAVKSYQSRNEPLNLRIPDSFPTIHKHLMHVPFYQNDVDWMEVISHDTLSVDGGEQGLRELCLQLPPSVTYETGDHIILYPRNSRCMVDAFLQLYKPINPHSVIVNGGPGYPHPVGISIHETLSHCVDLGALPSPSLARYLLQVENIDYKRDIAAPRRTILSLMHETGGTAAAAAAAPPLQDLLPMLPKMQPRYYSIASSPKVHPHQVVITYRPVKYIASSSGSSSSLREGVCTSYMTSLGRGSHMVGGVRSNPTFRLPSDPRVPVLFIAGGCGIAPIRAFLEDRVASLSLQSSSHDMGESILFLGFRSPSDQVYQDLIDQSLACGALSSAFVSYSDECTSVDQKCQLVTQTVREHGILVMDWIENRGAHVYLCGGARSFGAAMEATFLDLLQEQNGLDSDKATEYLRQLVAEGRLCEDLAD